MPTKGEKDEITGTEMTGHEWDGIRELDTPLPKWWLYVFYATIVWSLGYFILYPAIPGLTGYTQGVLDYSTRSALRAELEDVRSSQGQAFAAVAQAGLGEILGNPDLRQIAVAGGRASYLDNCAPCHGSGGAGGPGYPSLIDDVWLWGGTPEAILTTLRHGIRWEQDRETRFSLMPNYGADGILTAEQIGDLADYVLALSGLQAGYAAAPSGAALFGEQCAACHGANGSGNRELGAPALNDRIWLYGGEREDIVRQLRRSQHGVMPAWGGRLDEATLKMLTVYVHSLGGGE
ncbi:MAG: cytochrome-c oxidase, cbb3-type subunit III [Acetobacterales bacterium]